MVIGDTFEQKKKIERFKQVLFLFLLMGFSGYAIFAVAYMRKEVICMMTILFEIILAYILMILAGITVKIGVAVSMYVKILGKCFLKFGYNQTAIDCAIYCVLHAYGVRVELENRKIKKEKKKTTIERVHAILTAPMDAAKMIRDYDIFYNKVEETCNRL